MISFAETLVFLGASGSSAFCLDFFAYVRACAGENRNREVVDESGRRAFGRINERSKDG